MPDLEYEEIQEILSLPAEAIPGQVARRPDRDRNELC